MWCWHKLVSRSKLFSTPSTLRVCCRLKYFWSIPWLWTYYVYCIGIEVPTHCASGCSIISVVNMLYNMSGNVFAIIPDSRRRTCFCNIWTADDIRHRIPGKHYTDYIVYPWRITRFYDHPLSGQLVGKEGFEGSHNSGKAMSMMCGSSVCTVFCAVILKGIVESVITVRKQKKKKC